MKYVKASVEFNIDGWCAKRNPRREELAALLGVSTQTLYIWNQRQQIPYIASLAIRALELEG